jgi:hypothetical protein
MKIIVLGAVLLVVGGAAGALWATRILQFSTELDRW